MKSILLLIAVTLLCLTTYAQTVGSEKSSLVIVGKLIIEVSIGRGFKFAQRWNNIYLRV
jgi:hypothetical protein